MKNKLKDQIRKQNGITLVALVVTIIVLLILAGVSLNLVAGSNGIMNRATKAVEKHNIAAIGEEVELAMVELQAEYYEERYVNNNMGIANTFGTYAGEKLQNEGIKTKGGKLTSTDLSTVVYEDKQGNKIATGTFDKETGSISIAGITTDGSNPTPEEPKTPLAVDIIKPENYGDSVNYSANNVSDWKVFLNDGSNVYLISSDYVPNRDMTITDDVVLVDANDYCIKGKGYNQQYRDVLINWLTTEENWSAYASGFSGAMAYRRANKGTILGKL